MRKKIQGKIDHLRKQPEHVRVRFASYATIITGACMVIIWVGVLLPLQLRIASRSSTEDLPEVRVLEEMRQAQENSDRPGEPQVGGIRQQQLESEREQLFLPDEYFMFDGEDEAGQQDEHREGSEPVETDPSMPGTPSPTATPASGAPSGSMSNTTPTPEALPVELSE